jgi:hypothetical protein
MPVLVGHVDWMTQCCRMPERLTLASSVRGAWGSSVNPNRAAAVEFAEERLAEASLTPAEAVFSASGPTPER